MSYFYEYLVFLAEAVTIVVAVIVVLSALVSMSMKQQQHAHAEQGHLVVTKVNDRIRSLRHAMESSVLPPDEAKKQRKEEDKALSQAQKAESAALKARRKGQDKGSAVQEQDDKDVESDADPAAGRVFVLRFEGDVKASHVDYLRAEVSAVLTTATPGDEVVVCIESPGGMVHGYGLAASQLTRVRDHNVPLTVAVDKVAASGGYLMAAVANRIIAAPFALIGSIGVVAQIPNIHRLLKKNDVDVEVLTAGKYKRTLTVLGENTEEGRQKFVEELEDVHALFQEFVAENRPDVDLASVATGEAWYGKRALDLNLVDELSTSDEYLMRKCETHQVYELKWEVPQKPIDRLLGKVNTLLDQASSTLDVWRR